MKLRALGNKSDTCTLLPIKCIITLKKLHNFFKLAICTTELRSRRRAKKMSKFALEKEGRKLSLKKYGYDTILGANFDRICTICLFSSL